MLLCILIQENVGVRIDDIHRLVTDHAEILSLSTFGYQNWPDSECDRFWVELVQENGEVLNLVKRALDK